MNHMQLERYLRVLKKEGLLNSSSANEGADLLSSTDGKNGALLSRKISGLSSDSRDCRADCIFFCKGRGFSADHLTDAVKKGAVAVIYEPSFLSEVKDFRKALGSVTDTAVTIEVTSVKKAMAVISAFHYDYPMDKAVTVAITGTKGKTSVVTAVRDVLSGHKGFKAFILNEMLPEGRPHLTTPEAIDLHAAAYECVKRGGTHVVCEASSQGIKELRTYGIIFDTACFLNLDRDHVSPLEHPSEKDYFLSKASLFSSCKRAVICSDIRHAEEVIRIAEESPRILTDAKSGRKAVFTFSTTEKSSDFSVSERTEDERGSLITVKESCFSDPCGGEKHCRLYVNTAADFGVQNHLAAFSVCRVLGCTPDECFRGLLLSKTEGRMEIFDTVDARVRVIVDYAHNKMSFEALFGAVKRMYGGSPPPITSIFGCSGEKAYLRRYDLPAVALKHSDRIVICEDDSGREPFEKIKNEILLNTEKILSGYKDRVEKAARITVIRDRGQAIREAVNTAYENGERRLILFTGRGRETTMRLRNGESYYESDVSSTKSAIKHYDDRISLDTVFSELKQNKGKTFTVSFEEHRDVIESLAFSGTRLLGVGIIPIAISTVGGAKALRETCYKLGTVVHTLSYSAATLSEIKGTAEKVSKRGALTVIAVDGDEKAAASEISAREKSDALVYLTRSGGILLNGRPFPSVISEKACESISERFSSRYLTLALNTVKRGVGAVAVIDGRQRDALSFYGVGHGYMGTVIIKDKKA